MNKTPTRKTMKIIATWCMTLITVITVRTLMPPDLGVQSSSVLIIIVGFLSGVVGAWITGETYSAHSERKHSQNDESTTE